MTFDLIPKIQNFEDLKFSDENKLLLDIYVPPGKKEDEKLPVMVYIHGGSLLNGGPAEYPGNTNLPKMGNVVLVVIQYRLGKVSAVFNYSKNFRCDGILQLQRWRKNHGQFWIVRSGLCA